MALTLNKKTLAGLALLAAGGPFAVDMYLPAFPAIAADLQTTEPMVQLTLSAFMVGMAVGQLGVGALSDAHGRRRLLIAGTVVSVLVAACCALAPNIMALILARFVLGLGSGASVALARAVVSDLARGRSAASAFSVMMTIQGLAPVIAPIVGGIFAEPVGWRGLFWILTGLAVVQLLIAVLMVSETLPAEQRSKGGAKDFFSNLGQVLGNKVFIGYLLAFSFGFGGLFSYISASPFVVQGQLGLPPVAYSVVFALNSVAIVTGSAINARLVRHYDPHALLRNGVVALTLVGVALLVVPVSPWMILPLLFILAHCLGYIMGNSTALGTGAVQQRAGTGSALLGFGQFLVGGLVSPLVGLGDNPVFAMGVSVTVCGVVAVLGVLLASRRSTPTPR